MVYNYLLFMPSPMRSSAAEISFQIGGKADGTCPAETFPGGKQTNIPATKYLIHSLLKKGEKLHKIIMICSNETGEGTETYQYYTEEISAKMQDAWGYSAKECEDVFVSLPLEDITSINYMSMRKILSDILQSHLAGDGEKHLFIDYTSGLRNASMQLVIFARFLELGGIQVKDVFYSNISGKPGDNSLGTIESCMGAYHQFYYLDAFAAARSRNFEPLYRLALEDQDNEFAQKILRTKKSVENAMFIKTSTEDSAELPIGEDMDIIQKIGRQIVNEKRKTLSSVFDLLKSLMQNGDVANAAYMIREHGLEMLAENGILSWTYVPYSKADSDRVQVPEITGDSNYYFFAYTCYYRTYMRFVCEMLTELKDITDASEWKKQAENYYYQKRKLTPAPTENHELFIKYLKNEFRRYWENYENDFEQCLTDKHRNGTQTDEEVHRSAAYTSEYNRYMTTYLSAGFPFGNIYKTNRYESFSCCGKQWYNAVYRQALKKGIETVCEKPEEERAKIAACAEPYAGKDTRKEAELLPELLTESFPPAELSSLFTLCDADYTRFGKQLLVMDRIRRLRNEFFHNHNATEETVEEARTLVVEFIEWIDGKKQI